MLLPLMLLSACTSQQPDVPPSAATKAPKASTAPGVDAGSPAASTDTRPTAPVRNVILMINDGAGWGTWDAAAYWQYGSREGTPYAGFPVKYAMTTFPLNNEDNPTKDDVSRVNYDPEEAWDTRKSDDPDFSIEAYEYLDDDATDSAASGTAMASGIKTYQNAINVNNHGRPVEFITLLARAQGRATGVVT
ncbi:MAG: alkaline phosphatase, partial [Lautropia sp.]|nr:alkaline phosphatase [Lautropia sp.]